MKTQKLLFTFMLSAAAGLYSTVSAQSPGWQWAKAASGTNADSGQGVAVDASGNSIVAGGFSSPTATFGSTVLTNNTSSGDYNDVFVTKYNSAGTVLWAKRAGGNMEDVAYSVSTDAAGNIYVTGLFQSPSITFGTTTLTNAGTALYDIFIVKYDTNGNVVWAKRAGGNSEDMAYGITTDATGNSYITGYFYSSTVSFDAITLTNAGSMDAFVAKYDTNGNALWAKRTGGSSAERGRTIAMDAAGNVLVTGWYGSASLTFGTTTITNTDATGNTLDTFVAKYDNAGNPLLAFNIGGTGDDISYGITSDASNDIIVTGAFNSPTLTIGGTALTNAGGSFGTVPYDDAFIAKYNNSGVAQWARRTGGNKEDFGSTVSTDAAGNIITCGNFGSGFVNFNTLSVINTDVSSAASSDIYIVKYTAAGTPVWAKGAGGTLGDVCQSAALDASANLVITGGYASTTVAFGSTTLTNASSGEADIFIAKTSGTTGIEEAHTEAFNITVAPNPFAAEAIIYFDKPLRNARLTIVDMLGSEVFSTVFSGDQLRLERAEMPKGIYFIRVTDEDKNVVNRKIIIQ